VGRLKTIPVVACIALAATAARGDVSERLVTFAGAGGVKLSGTLTLPASASGDARVPAVVLVQGSGPTDRDGNQPPLLWTGLLKQLAGALADGGIASLRYDKRGMYRSGDRPKDPEALAEFVSWDHFVGDVVAAHQALRRRPEIDAGRVGLVGHSEGGLLVMDAAAALQKAGTPPAALVVMATPGRSLDVVLREQLNASFERLGVARAGIEKVLEKNDAVVAHIREHGTVPPDVPPDLQPLYPRYIGRFLQAQFNSLPAEVAGRVEGPVLLVQGDRDIQVSAERDLPVLAEALGKRAGASRCDVALIEGASHNLKPVEKEGEYGLFGPMVPEARRRVVSWLAEVLGAPRT
jgi:hypothetical protein